MKNFVCLHTGLVLAPVERPPWVIPNLFNNRLAGTSTTGSSIAAEDTVSHEFRVEASPVTKLHGRETLTFRGDAVCNDSHLGRVHLDPLAVIEEKETRLSGGSLVGTLVSPVTVPQLLQVMKVVAFFLGDRRIFLKLVDCPL